MNFILICCVLLFIVYSSIIGLLLYYFLKDRVIWNTFWSDCPFLEMDCQVHSWLYTCLTLIPGYIHIPRVNGVTTCTECEKQAATRETDIYQLETLSSIYKLLKSLSARFNELRLYQHLLEYIIRNYKEIRDCNLAIYEQMEKLYLADVTETNPCMLHWQLEDIPLLESISESCKNILDILSGVDYARIDSVSIIALLQGLQSRVLDVNASLKEI